MPNLEQFSLPVINTKKIIKRKGLMAQITESAYRSVLFIHAPAGYGKTTAAVQWISGRKTAWFSLDEYSSQPVNFYKGIMSALSAKIPESFDAAPQELLIEAIQKIKEYPDVLVIDDFHYCNDDRAAETLMMIRRRIPENTSFLVLSRNPPPEVLNKYILSGNVRQISGLRFSSDEVYDLFHKNNSAISRHDAEMLCNQTDGWAASLTAILMSDSGEFAGVPDRNTLNQYLKSHVFTHSELFNELKKCSVCETLNTGLCEALTGRADAWEAISSLAKKTGLVSRYGDDTCKFHDLLREFLRLELETDDRIDKPLLYKTAAYWYRENGDWIHALDMAAKSGDHGAMEETARIASERFNSLGVDITAYIHFVEKAFLSIPTHIVEQYPRLSGVCFISSLMSRPFSEACMWVDVLEKQFENGLVRSTDNISAAFQRAVDPRRSSWYVQEQFKRIRGLLEGEMSTKHSNMVSISLNFPFFHKAQRDYTDISRELPEYTAEFVNWLEPAAGPIVNVLAALIEAGVRYERGELSEAETVVESVVKNASGLSPELRFCVYTLYTERLRVCGKKAEPEIIGEMIESTGARYLLDNYLSFLTYMRLYGGDISEARNWFKREGVPCVLQLYKIHRYFTTARAMMVLRKFSEAAKLLERLAGFSRDYRRNADYIESLTLRSICLWRGKRISEAVKTFTDAIVKASELQIIMPIIKEGADIMPLLQKISGRLKYGYDSDKISKTFVGELYKKARNISKHTPGMLSQIDTKPAGLSPKQSEVIRYLSQNLSYKEIAEKMGVTKAAVNYHIRALHGKFDVSNTRDLLRKVDDLGITDIE